MSSSPSGNPPGLGNSTATLEEGDSASKEAHAKQASPKQQQQQQEQQQQHAPKQQAQKPPSLKPPKLQPLPPNPQRSDNNSSPSKNTSPRQPTSATRTHSRTKPAPPIMPSLSHDQQSSQQEQQQQQQSQTKSNPAVQPPPPLPPPPDQSNTPLSPTVQQTFEETSREAVHKFFYPPAAAPASAIKNPRPAPDPRKKHEHLKQSQKQQRLRHEAPPRTTTGPQQQQQTPRTSGEEHRPHTRPSTMTTNAVPVQASPSRDSSVVTSSSHQEEFDEHFRQQEQEDEKFVSDFWHLYDDIIILSLFSQLGIVARLGSSLWFSFFDGVFSNDSPLFVNLPLNCLSCFILGMLCSGESCMEIITTRFSPPRLQQQIQTQSLVEDSSENDGVLIGDDDEDDHHEDDGSFHRMERQSSSTPNSPQHPSRGGLVRTAIPDTPPSISRHTRQFSHDSDPGSSWGTGSNNTNNRGGIFRRRRRRKRDKRRGPTLRSWQPPMKLNEDLRDVQLLALERRIRQSKCLLLFPVKKEDVDVMEHYFDSGYRKDKQQTHHINDDDHEQRELFEDEMDGLYLQESYDEEDLERNNNMPLREMRSNQHDSPSISNRDPLRQIASSTITELPVRSTGSTTKTHTPVRPTGSTTTMHSPAIQQTPSVGTQPPASDTAPENSDPPVELHGEENPADLNQIVNEVSANVTERISRLSRVNIANGWDVGTSAEDMSDDIMLGLRFGFCGALSSFSSWNSAMINLIRHGKIGEAFMGYIFGLQLPIISYRFGQYVAVYVFVWRCRRETKRDERRGYGIQLHTQDEDDQEGEEVGDHEGSAPSRGLSGEDSDARNKDSSIDSQTPSIRAIITIAFMMALVTQCTSISFYSEPQNQVVALSLLFSPMGVLARWRLSKYNSWRPSFPIGTFTCNMMACALSGGLGRLLAGHPGKEERLVLVGFINGFGGTLSSVANFIVEILAGMDPILLRFDGLIYALWSIFWAVLVGFVFSASADWADSTGR